MTRKRLYLIDGANYVFRAHYAIRTLSTSKGLPTGALYGYTQMLLKLLRDEKPDLVAICFDTKEPTFRDEMYADYKATRKAPPDDLIQQFPYVKPITQALGFPIIEKPGFEADDIIGTLAKRYSSKGYEVVIVSSDKDLMQLIGPNVTMLDEMKVLRIGPKEVEERFGVSPEGVVEVLALAGDTSDNVPGIPGIGPKTASTLIKKYGTVEGVIAHADELKGALAERVRANVENARLSRRLVEVDTSVDVGVSESDLAMKQCDEEAIHGLFKELEFSKLLALIAPRKTLGREGYRLVSDERLLSEVMERIEQAGELSLSIETSLFDPMQAEVAGFALSWGKGEAAYIPVGHVAAGGSEGELFAPTLLTGQIDRTRVWERLRPILSDSKIKKFGHNLNYVLTILKRLGFDVRGVAFDTMLASYVLDPAGEHSRDALAERYLDHRAIRYEEVVGKGRSQKDFAQVSLDAARDYACEGVDVVLGIAKILQRRIEEAGLSELFYEMEMPLVDVLVDMQIAGVKIDIVRLGKLSKKFSVRLAELEKEIYALAGGPFNINSPRQLGQLLFEKMKLPGAKRTKTGFSTSQDILEDLAVHHDLAKLVLDYRSLTKLKSTYIDALPELINPSTGRIHTSFNQAVAATGRLSSSDPNLQNIPIRGDDGKKIREAFVADDGFVFLSADYSQIELRVLAHMSGDETLLDAFRKGLDVHAITASGIFGVAPGKITSEQRSVGKTVNFATIYGQTPFGLSKQLRIDVGNAAAYIENYFKKYPRVAKYRDEVIQSAKKQGRVETLFGRRRFLPDISSTNTMLSQNAERAAFNTVFQGTAADIIKRAMIAIYQGLPGISPKSRMILQVHDELIFEVPEGDVDAVKGFVVGEMMGAAKLTAPLVVDCGIGQNWADAW